MKNAMREARLMTEARAAEYLGLSRAFLRKSRMDGHRSAHAEAPPYIKTGRMIRYAVDDLDAWIERHRHEVRGGRRHGTAKPSVSSYN